jgi:hypothetical protein
MPLWGWILLIACLGAFLLIAVAAITRGTHRLPEDEPLHGDPTNIAAPLPMHVAEADSMSARELEAERGRVDDGERISGTPTPRTSEARGTH